MSWVSPEEFAAQIVRSVCELPDYNSPDEQPNLLQCTVEELRSCIIQAFEHFGAQKMLTQDETMVFACLLKKLGGDVIISLSEMENVRGWKVEWQRSIDNESFRYKLTRVGETIEGESTGLHASPPAGSAWLSPQHRLLSLRRAFLAQESESLGTDEVPPNGFFGEEG